MRNKSKLSEFFEKNIFFRWRESKSAYPEDMPAVNILTNAKKMEAGSWQVRNEHSKDEQMGGIFEIKNQNRNQVKSNKYKIENAILAVFQEL